MPGRRSTQGGAGAVRCLGATPRLRSADLRRTADFYAKTLGFEVCVLWPEESPVFCLLRRGRAALAFDLAPGFEGSKAEADGFYLHVDDALALCKAIKESVRIEWGPEVYHYHCREFAFRDPDGYLVIVSEETSDPPDCEDR